MSNDLEHFEIQSVIDKNYGASIYPYNPRNRGYVADGYCLLRLSDKKAFSPAELRKIAGDAVVDELLKDCKNLHGGTTYG